MSRWRAAGYHLLLSVAIIAAVSAGVVWLWYPLALIHVAGVDRLIGIIAAVDVTVGPLLTLIVYKHGKKGMTFDLTVIALVQLALLSYGLHALSMKRPVFLVGVVDRFELVAANQIAESDLAKASPPYDRLSWTGAALVGAPLPDDPQQRSDLLFDSVEGRDIHLQPRFFKPFDVVGAGIANRGTALPRFLERLPSSQQDAVRNALGDRPVNNASALALSTANGTVTMLVDATTGQPLGAVTIDYWKAVRHN